VDRFGFIREKLDIKILILFIIRRLPGEVGEGKLSSLILVDDGINYFDYMECLSELERTGHITIRDGKYRITAKGDRNGEAIESSIPYSVRSKAERAVSELAAEMRRNAMIGTSHVIDKNGSPIIELSLSDGMGEILSLHLLASSEEEAKTIESNFRFGAEGIYNKIIEILLEKNEEE
jgi:hypothetical protein